MNEIIISEDDKDNLIDLFEYLLECLSCYLSEDEKRIMHKFIQDYE